MRTMTTYQITLPQLIHNGVEYEPTGEFRPPNSGEVYIDASGCVSIAKCDCFPPRIILRPGFVYPAIKGWGFALDNSGETFWHEKQPEMNCYGYWHSRGVSVTATTIQALGFDVPPITDHTQPVKNPNWEENA